MATWEVIYYRFTPDFGDAYAAYNLEQVKKSGASDAEIATKTAEMERYKEMYRKPLVNIALTFLEPLPVGIVFTLVTAGILSRKRRAEGPVVA